VGRPAPAAARARANYPCGTLLSHSLWPHPPRLPSPAAALCQTYVMQPGEGLESVVTKFGRVFNIGVFKGESAGGQTKGAAAGSSLVVLWQLGRPASCKLHSEPTQCCRHPPIL
jgi:hypothetical protein